MSGDEHPGDAAPPVPGAEERLSALTLDAPRLTVELLPDGRMRAPHLAARDLLRDRLKQARLLPCAPGWMVLRSEGESRVPPSPDVPEVVAAGVLGPRGLSLIDFLGFLEAGDGTGILAVATRNLERALFLHRGALVWATSTEPEEQLTALMVRRGRLSEEDRVLLDGDPTARHQHGQACVARGLASAESVAEMTRAQVVEIFDHVLAMDAGMWTFARVAEGTLDDAPLHIPAQGLLMDALRRMDEMMVYRQRIRSSAVRLGRAGHAAAGPSTTDLVHRMEGEIRDDARALLDVLTAPASLAELMRKLGCSEFEATRAAYHLLRSSLVQIVPDAALAPPAAPNIEASEARGIISIYSMAIREVFDDVTRLGQAYALRAAARAFLADEAGSGVYAQLLRNVVLRPDGTLEVDSVLRGMAMAPVSAEALNDALSEVLFFVLFQATELLGRRQGDDLARRVKMIHDLLPARPSETP
ncbi:MAG: DUF4388 domain-containing protein [Deltaproteobacteria bacterium]|nr:DUF4388 domain-containing protein [Deltaproteobacteria bacterium]